MKVLIIVDLEGIVGITKDHSMFGKDATYFEAKKLLLRECQVIITELNKNHIYNITICDSHDKGNNIDIEKIKYIGKLTHIKKPHNINFHTQYNFAFLIGMHGMTATNDFFAHSYRSEISYLIINDRIVGETSFLINLLEEKSIPVILVSGTDYALEEILLHTNIHKYSNSLNTKYKHIISAVNLSIINYRNKNIITIPREKAKVFIVINDFIDPIYLKNKIWNISKNSIEFLDSIEFLQKIDILSMDLNNYYNENFFQNKFLLEYLKEKRDCLKDHIHDKKIRYILDKSLYNISYKERLYLYEKIK